MDKTAEWKKINDSVGEILTKRRPTYTIKKDERKMTWVQQRPGERIHLGRKKP